MEDLTTETNEYKDRIGFLENEIRLKNADVERMHMENVRMADECVRMNAVCNQLKEEYDLVKGDLNAFLQKNNVSDKNAEKV